MVGPRDEDRRLKRSSRHPGLVALRDSDDRLWDVKANRPLPPDRTGSLGAAVCRTRVFP